MTEDDRRMFYDEQAASELADVMLEHGIAATALGAAHRAPNDAHSAASRRRDPNDHCGSAAASAMVAA